MLRYLVRHAGDVPHRLRMLTKDARLNPSSATFDRSLYARTIQEALEVRRSGRERWDDPTTPGFWSRWLTWSHPDLDDAKAHIKRHFAVSFVA